MPEAKCAAIRIFLFRHFWNKPADSQWANGRVIFPPDDGEVVDEDSGEEDSIVINNLPGAQLRSEAEVVLHVTKSNSDYDSEDNLPLPHFAKRQKVSRQKKKYRATCINKKWYHLRYAPLDPPYVPK